MKLPLLLYPLWTCFDAMNKNCTQVIMKHLPRVVCIIPSATRKAYLIYKIRILERNLVLPPVAFPRRNKNAQWGQSINHFLGGGVNYAAYTCDYVITNCTKCFSGLVKIIATLGTISSMNSHGSMNLSLNPQRLFTCICIYNICIFISVSITLLHAHSFVHFLNARSTR